MRLSCIGLCIALFASSVAHADDTAAARDHYQRARLAFNLGHYEEAAQEYDAAYRAKEDPALLFNLAQAYRLGGKLDEALRAYKSFRQNAPKAPNRTDVDNQIVHLEQQIAARDEAAAQRRAAEAAAAPAPRPETPAPAIVETPRPVDTAPSHAGRSLRVAGYAVGATGVVLLGAGIAMGVLSKQNSDAVGSASRTGGTFDPSKQSAGRTESALFGTFIGVGAVAVVGGIVLAVVGHKKDKASAHARVDLSRFFAFSYAQGGL